MIRLLWAPLAAHIFQNILHTCQHSAPAPAPTLLRLAALISGLITKCRHPQLQSFFVHFNLTSFFSFQIVRHPSNVRVPVPRTRYGQPTSNETSPLATRKTSVPAPVTPSPTPASPVMSRRSVGPLATAPQRPSKLPVMPMYGHPAHNSRTGSSRAQGYTQRKTTSPDSGVTSDQETLSPASPATRYRLVTTKRPASPQRTGSKRPGHASPKRGDVTRRVSSPVFTARRRSPSMTRSVSFISAIN